MSMEEENNLPSDSDNDDDDYVPTGTGEALSEDESGNESNEEEGDSGEDTEPAGKRKKHQKKSRKSRKKVKPVEEKENEKEEPEKEDISFEMNKKRVSALWEDFLKDVGGPVVKKKDDVPKNTEDKPMEEKKEAKAPTPQQPAKVKITELFEFAGEKVVVEREVETSSVSSSIAGSGHGRVKTSSGISGILGQLGKKGKLSTLEKSKLDWDKFKKQEGIDEQLDSFNKGKDGFLERQDFLQRTDLRQFEIEKEMRNKRRSSNR